MNEIVNLLLDVTVSNLMAHYGGKNFKRQLDLECKRVIGGVVKIDKYNQHLANLIKLRIKQIELENQEI